ncbi:MAG TPA: CinA family protein [Thermomicrobiales bacterium]
MDVVEGLSRQLGAALRARGLTIATAESCTGGAVAAALAAIPGASEYLRGGVVAYSAAVKTALLGVPAAIIDADGVVSAACAQAMARGGCAACGADIAVATTGIAGPGGAEPGKPVGTVFLAVACPAGTTSREMFYTGDRAAIIAAATRDALGMAREVVSRES